jgi:hypothetical protein
MITENPAIIIMVTSITLTYAKTRNHLLTDMKGLSKKKSFFYYLQVLFLIVIAEYIRNQVYTKVVINVKRGLYNHNPSSGFLNLYSTAYIIPVNITPAIQNNTEVKSPLIGKIAIV